MSRQITWFVLFHDCRHLNFPYQPAIIYKRFETNSSFHFKWPTAGKVQFLLCTIFVMVLTTFSFREEDKFSYVHYHEVAAFWQNDSACFKKFTFATNNLFLFFDECTTIMHYHYPSIFFFLTPLMSICFFEIFW